MKIVSRPLTSSKKGLEKVFLSKKHRRWSFSVTWNFNIFQIMWIKFCNKTKASSPAHPSRQSQYMTSSPKSSSSSRCPPRQTHPPWARRVGERQDLPLPQPWLQVSYPYFLWKPWSGISYSGIQLFPKSAGAILWLCDCLGGSFTLSSMSKVTSYIKKEHISYCIIFI